MCGVTVRLKGLTWMKAPSTASGMSGSLRKCLNLNLSAVKSKFRLPVSLSGGCPQGWVPRGMSSEGWVFLKGGSP